PPARGGRRREGRPGRGDLRREIANRRSRLRHILCSGRGHATAQRGSRPRNVYRDQLLHAAHTEVLGHAMKSTSACCLVVLTTLAAAARAETASPVKLTKADDRVRVEIGGKL